ncbi:DUF2169 family type VI secretion system accessory protein [Consotaella aegiceratis]|uniref:DUF2169 family type VI secretion system accessory protein n=1 Tax=Consotaella aegiceratis TaxID=3097961 RepID=UPI002F3FB9A6
MPELVNLTPFPNFRYYSRDNKDEEFGIVIVKATYEVAPSGRLLQAEEQAPMVFTDLCHGEVNVSSLWHPSDLVPNKPATDVIVNAVARAPGGKPMPFWHCGLAIADGSETRVDKTLRVTGPREWAPVWRRRLSEAEQAHWHDHRRAFDRWRLSDPQPIAALPLHYEYAYGGEIAMGTDEDGQALFDTDERNPLGRGKMDREWTDHTRHVPAPQIEDPNDPVREPFTELSPQSLGPIPPAWLPRRPRGGTYDQNWMDNIWPAWPPDYDFSYHNSAHPDLIVSPHLKGGERVTLTGLAEAAETVTLVLPQESLFVDFVRDDGRTDRQDMALDTVFLDIAAKRRRDWRVYLSWRVNFEPDIYSRAVIQYVASFQSAAQIRAGVKARAEA